MCAAHGSLAYHTTGLCVLRLFCESLTFSVQWSSNQDCCRGDQFHLANSANRRLVNKVIGTISSSLLKKFNSIQISGTHSFFFFFSFLGLLYLNVSFCHTAFTWVLWLFQVCGKALPCGNHTCERVCHAGPCGDCPRSGKRFCPCGKSSKPFFFFPSKLNKCHPAFDCQQFRLLKQCKVHKKFLQSTVKAETYLSASFFQSLI